ncbi:hypothetical protein [Streptomyces sp. NPDC048111]
MLEGVHQVVARHVGAARDVGRRRLLVEVGLGEAREVRGLG